MNRTTIAWAASTDGGDMSKEKAERAQRAPIKKTKPKTAAVLAAKGYVPRLEAARQLRRYADGLEHGDKSMFIRTPVERPNLWVKFNMNLYYENAEQE